MLIAYPTTESCPFCNAAPGWPCVSKSGVVFTAVPHEARPRNPPALAPEPPRSKAASINPKDAIGSTKVSLSKFPAIGVAMGALAMMDGAEKYGAYNWRDKDVRAGIYVDAAMRHLQCWFEGQEAASDSGVHHLGHAIACCAILLDAQASEKLVDDRPFMRGEGGGPLDPSRYERMLAGLGELIRAKRAKG